MSRPIDRAIDLLMEIELRFDSVMQLMEESFDQGVILGDDGNLELFVEIENKIPLLTSRFRKIRSKLDES